MECSYLDRARARTSTGNEPAGTCVPSIHTNATTGAGATNLGHAALDTGEIIWAVPCEIEALGGASSRSVDNCLRHTGGSCQKFACIYLGNHAYKGGTRRSKCPIEEDRWVNGLKLCRNSKHCQNTRSGHADQDGKPHVEGPLQLGTD